MTLRERLRQALTTNSAETSADAEDVRLRGRTYSVPFDHVWRAALGIAEGGARGWRLVSADDESGEIVAEASRFVLGIVDDVKITIVLDEDAQTRVDMRSAARGTRGDLGTNARRIDSFFRRLDRLLERRDPRLPLEPPTAA